MENRKSKAVNNLFKSLDISASSKLKTLEKVVRMFKVIKIDTGRRQRQ